MTHNIHFYSKNDSEFNENHFDMDNLSYKSILNHWFNVSTEILSENGDEIYLFSKV